MSRHLAIVGPTASGKTDLALALVRERPSLELVSLDAMAVYKGMDIGTSKPSPEELAGVVCHGINLVEPSQEFAVVDLMEAVRPMVASAAERGKLIAAVGGTGLYVRALADGLEFPRRYPEIAMRLEAEADTSVLYERLRRTDPAAAVKILPNNRRRVVRALEVCEGSGRPFSSHGPGLTVYPDSDFLQVGLRMSRSLLDTRISRRLEEQMEAGFVEEVKRLAAAPGGMSRTARQALGYKEILDFLGGKCSLGEAKSTALRRIVHFARRQERLFRRDPRIRWVDIREDPLEALPAIRETLEQCL